MNQVLRTVSIVGDRYRFLITGEQTGGAYAMFDFHVPPHHGPPPHIHHREDEFFYVLEGEFEFNVAGEIHRLGAGQTIIGETTGRMICTVCPAGLENFFDEVGTVLAGPDADPVPPAESDIQKLIATAPRYGMEVLPPPAAEAKN
jgi:hypothetical protein